MKKKIVVNHFEVKNNFSNGVINYSKSMINVLDGDYELYSKKSNVDQEQFQHQLLRKINSYSSYNEITIEAAESQASTLLLPRETNTHIRMHCPFHLYKRVIDEIPDEQRYSNEIRALYKAKAISSPSYGMLEYLNDDLDCKKVHVFKNPVDPSIEYASISEKDIDVIFLLRFNKLKGAEYINPVLRLLPDRYKVYLIGKQEEPFFLDSRVKCDVTILPHVEGDEKIDLLRRSRASLSLSKFENCSMVILESIGAGTPVVCWDVGGNSEIANFPVVSPIEYEDVFAFSDRIRELIENNNYPTREEFIKAKELINNDFISGIRHIEKVLLGENETIYRGLSCTEKNTKKLQIPYELRDERWSNLETRPFKIVVLAKSIEYLKTFISFLKNNKISGDILFMGQEHTKDLETDMIIVSKLNWIFDRQSCRRYLREARAEIVLLEEPGFTNKTKKDEYIRFLQVPVIFSEHLKGINSIFFDRFGKLNQSRFKKLNFLAPSTESKNIKFNEPRVKLIVGCKTRISNYELDHLQKTLETSGISFCYTDVLLDTNPSKHFYIMEEYSEKISDYIIWDDSQLIRYLGSANIYVKNCSAFLGKAGISSIDDIKILGNSCTVPHLEEMYVRDFFYKKLLNKGAIYEDFQDECYAVLNQRSYKRNAI